MPEVFSDNFSTTLASAITSTTRPVTFTVAATSADLAGGTFSIIIFDVGTDANPLHAEILKVTDGSTTTWTASPEPGHSATTHAAGSTVRQILTRRSITQQMVDHVDVVGSPDPHTQYVRENTFQQKGDSLVGLGSGTFTREAVGADGTALIADSTQTTGRRWGVPGLGTLLSHMGDIIVGGLLGAASRLGIGTAGQVLTVVQNSPTVSNPVAGPTCTAGSSGGSLVNATSYDFAYEWSTGAAPDGGNTLPSPRTTFTATSTGRVNVQAPAAPIAGLTLYVYIGAPSGTLFRAPGTIPNASTSTPNIITISAVVGSGTQADGANTTGGLSAVWSTSANVSSVGLTVPSEFAVTGSPITSSGTLAVTKANQSSGTFWSGPSSGSPAAPTFRAIVPADLPVLTHSGTGHAPGIAPDPGSSAGTTKFLREDATWATPTGGSTMVASGASHAGGLVPDPGSTAATTHYLREDATWAIPPGGFTNPMTTIADIIVAGASGVANRLAAGTTGQILSMLSSTSIGWTRAVDVMTAVGDLITGGTSGAPTRLAPGTAGTYLQSNGAGSALTWTVPAGTGGSGGLAGSSYHEEFAPTVSSTTVTLANTPTTILTVFRDGVAQSLADGHYSVSGSVITFGTVFLASERVVVNYVGPQALLTQSSNLISETVVSSPQASISVSNIPQNYRDLRITSQVRGSASATDITVALRLNGDSGSNYDWVAIENTSGVASELGSNSDTSMQVARVVAATGPASSPGSFDLLLANYSGATFHKTSISNSNYKVATTSGSQKQDFYSGYWKNTSPVTSLSLIPSSGNFDVGTVIRVYGEPVAAGGLSVGTGTRVRISTNQSIATATATAINWDVEDSDADNQHFTSSAALTGTVAKTATSTTLVGTSTLFTSELSVGQVISVPGTAAEVAVVTAIASDTSLTVATQFANTASGQTATRLNSPVVFRQPGFYTLESAIYSAALSTGTATLQFRLNGTIVIGQQDVTGLNASSGYELAIQRQFQQWDYVEVLWTQNSGGSVNVVTDERTHFSVNSRPTVLVAIPYINIQDQKSSGTNGGTFTSGSWQTRDLNTVVSNSVSVGSLSSNQITLPAGTYRCNISTPAYTASGVQHHVARLQNITDSATIAIGTGARSAATAMGVSVITARFTLATSKVLEVQDQCVTTQAANGLGVCINIAGVIEVYSVAEFWKEG